MGGEGDEGEQIEVGQEFQHMAEAENSVASGALGGTSATFP